MTSTAIDTKKKVLLVEDDPNLGMLLQEYLHHKNFEVDLKRNGDEGLLAYRRGQYDMILLDVMMPKKDGFAVAEEIRSEDMQTPIIFLTAKSLKEDKIKGLTIGADDYITKPFSMEVLELKINAILRRTDKLEKPPIQDEYEAGNTRLDYKNQKLIYKGKEQHLTTKENELLRMFFERKTRCWIASLPSKRYGKTTATLPPAVWMYLSPRSGNISRQTHRSAS